MHEGKIEININIIIHLQILLKVTKLAKTEEGPTCADWNGEIKLKFRKQHRIIPSLKQSGILNMAID